MVWVGVNSFNGLNFDGCYVIIGVIRNGIGKREGIDTYHRSTNPFMA